MARRRTLVLELDKLDRELGATSTYYDDPEADGMPYEHPAFGRGEVFGVKGAVTRINLVLDNNDNGAGIIADEELELCRRRVLALVRDADCKHGKGKCQCV